MKCCCGLDVTKAEHCRNVKQSHRLPIQYTLFWNMDVTGVEGGVVLLDLSNWKWLLCHNSIINKVDSLFVLQDL